MKIEKLNENKIKITFNIDDLAEKNIDLYSFMHNTPETQDLFWDLLNEAEKEYGFNVDNSMIYVEASTSGSGNFTLIVTKTNEKPYNLHTSYRRKNIKLKKKTHFNKLENSIFVFETFDDICEFTKTIDADSLASNTLYSMEGKYYLETSSMPYNNILEYANVCNNVNTTTAKLKEYGKEIAEKNALKKLKKYFNK